MKTILSLGGIICLLCSCVKDASVNLPISQIQPQDQANYLRDSSLSDAFCDFRLLDNSGGCWNTTLTVFEDCHYNLLFTRYGNGWTGADATYSLPLPNGRILWMFGDTFLGTVQADRSRKGGGLLRNTLVVQDGDELQTLFSGTLAAPKAFVSPISEHEWYWPLDATIVNGQIQWMLGRLQNTNTGGMWGFEYSGFDLAILNLNDFSIEQLVPKISDPDISYGSCLLEDDEFTYIYGISTRPFRKRAHVARVRMGNLDSKWTFYNGTEWVEHPSDYVIQEGVSDQFSMIKDGQTYYLITHEIIFGRKIFIAESDSPVGPFNNIRVLYCTPESGGNIFTYNTFAHPELSENGELRLSYNINSFDFSDLFRDVDLYRPKFISVENWK